MSNYQEPVKFGIYCAAYGTESFYSLVSRVSTTM